MPVRIRPTCRMSCYLHMFGIAGGMTPHVCLQPAYLAYLPKGQLQAQVCMPRQLGCSSPFGVPLSSITQPQ